jgi:GDP-4-dehydro-6-deoxy-D-mannose reductase
LDINRERVLITGCGGFIGSYLAELLLKNGLIVHGIAYQHNKNLEHLDKLIVHIGNIVDGIEIKKIIFDVKPNYVFHLAAQSLIPVSWKDPEQTFTTNTIGTIHLLEAIKESGLDPIVEIVGSSDEYASDGKKRGKILESDTIQPSSPYGISKLAADLLGDIYWRKYNMRIMRIRPFSIIGPRKISDACSDFARRIIDVESGRETTIKVGNLEVVRDFLDVRDAVRAMWVIAQKGKPGQVYNICSGTGSRIKDILDRMISFANCRIEIIQAPELIRSIDRPSLIGDCFKLSQLGWKPEIPLENTFVDIISYWRKVDNLLK